MKRILMMSGVCVALMGRPAHAQIQVDSVTADFNAIKELANEVKTYALQAQQYATQALQYQQEVEQYVAFVHDPTLGAAMGLMNQVGLGNSLPINPAALQQLTSGNSGLLSTLSALGNLTNSSYTQNHIYSPTDGSWNSQQLIANAVGISGTQGAAQAAYQDLRNHMPVIQALRDRLATSTTPKDVQDAQAEIEAETLWTHNLNTQLAAVEADYRTQQDARVQRDNEALDQGIDAFLAEATAAGRGL